MHRFPIADVISPTGIFPMGTVFDLWTVDDTVRSFMKESHNFWYVVLFFSVLTGMVPTIADGKLWLCYKLACRKKKYFKNYVMYVS